MSPSKKQAARMPSAPKKSGVNHKSKANQPMGRKKDKQTIQRKGKTVKKMVAKAANALFNSQQPNPPSGGDSMA